MSPGPPEMSKSYQEESKNPQEIKNQEQPTQPTIESPAKAPNKQRQLVANNEAEVDSLGDEDDEDESNIYDDPIDLKLRESAKQICDDVYSKVSKPKPAAEENGCNMDEKKRRSEISLSSQEVDLEESLSNAIYASINKAAKKNKEVNLESVTSTMI